MATQHYIKNADFLAAIVEYKKQVKEAAAAGQPKPRIPEYIGECILKIAEKLSTNFRFNQYTFKDEMISDGYENCLLYFDNFNPEKFNEKTGKKYDNPFAYYTQIIWYAFIRRIQKEKRQMLIKGKILQEMPYDVYDLQEHDEDGSGNAVETYLETMRNSGAFNDVVVKDEERRGRKKKKIAEPEPPEDLIEEIVHEVEDG